MVGPALQTETNLILPCARPSRLAPYSNLTKDLKLRSQLHTGLRLARIHLGQTRTRIHSPTSRTRQPKQIRTSNAHCQNVALELCENTTMRMTTTRPASLKKAMAILIPSECGKNGKSRKRGSSVHAASQGIMTVTSRGRESNDSWCGSLLYWINRVNGKSSKDDVEHLELVVQGCGSLRCTA